MCLRRERADRLRGLLQPYQRISDAVDAQIQRWGQLALGLRQMQAQQVQLYIGPLALRTLNQRLHLLQHLEMIAMGVGPDSDRREILLWRLAESESADAWVAFLEQLEAQSLRGAGLCAALQTVGFGAAEQRCLFHKLRNIARALRLPESLTPDQRRRQRRKILNAFRHIWAARQYATILQRYLDVVRTYRGSQPEAVATLRRDFRATVTYYALEAEFPAWERRHLRTTSRLERFNRTLRRRTRAAGAYHSEAGLTAMMAQEIRHFHDAQPSP